MLSIMSILLKTLYYASYEDIRACSAGNITQETFMGQVQIGIFHLYKYNNLLEPHKQDGAGMVRVVPDGEESGVSSPIRSINPNSTGRGQS
jgi:hypothetical protein